MKECQSPAMWDHLVYVSTAGPDSTIDLCNAGP